MSGAPYNRPTWRIIPLAGNSAAMNMALDEAVLESVAAGGKPTLRFYTWNPSAVSIGTFQSMCDEVDVEKCRATGVDIVRRRTGGGAVYHDTQGEITYSVVAKEGLFPHGITESYHVICGWIVDSLKQLGIESSFKPINDIIAGGKKISGNAQTRRQGVLLQHGTILYDVDVDTMFSLLKVPDEKIRDKIIATVKERVTRVLDFTDVSRDSVVKNLMDGFTAGKQFEISTYTEKEWTRARELADTFYNSSEWNFKR
jgi:lipoate---protein ligase